VFFWLIGFFLGDSGLREYEIRTAPKSKKLTDAATVAQRLETLRNHVRVYFPSEKAIEQSLGGKHVSARSYPSIWRLWDLTMTGADRIECRNDLLPLALVEPDHVSKSRDERLPEQPSWHADAQQGALCTTAPRAGVKLVGFVPDTRVRVCRECQSVRERMVSAEWTWFSA
jgi:hypothetical protein